MHREFDMKHYKLELLKIQNVMHFVIFKVLHYYN